MQERLVNILDVLYSDKHNPRQLNAENEKSLKKMFETFECEKNEEIETFLKRDAIEFAKQRISITNLVLETGNGDKTRLLGYFTLANKPIQINAASMSGTKRRRLQRCAAESEQKNIFNVSSMLIAQLGKNSAVKNNPLTGELLLGSALALLASVQRVVGGGIVFLECEQREKLMQFYGRNDFFKFGERSSSEGKNYFQLLKFL
ncbi:MAG: hypothetical protein Q4E34_06345 [Synergistaceae bacterium]|nr:hypothetical protein [Synergistaceae bacterium]